MMLKKCSGLKNWFIKLGFWKKIILIFTVNTMIILVIMNVLMEILFGEINSNILEISASETSEYISISNSLVGLSIANSLLSGMEIFSDVIVQIDSCIHFFRNRTDMYVSLLSGVEPYNPPLASSLNTKPDFRKPAAYFYGRNTSFHNEPYVEVLLSNILGSIQQQRIKRVNVIYQSLQNPSDIFAVTVPGTKDFTIPSITEVNNRFGQLSKDFITITGIYNDSFSLYQPTNKLLSLRTVQYNADYRILMETEIHQKTFSSFFSKVFYYQSTQIVVFQILQSNPPIYQLMNVHSFQINLAQCFKHGVHEFDLLNGTVLSAYSIAVNQSFAIGQSPHIIPHDSLSQMTDLFGSFRIVMLVDKDELSTPNGFISNFLDNQQRTLSIIIYGWSIVILLATVGLSIVTGNYIFQNLKTLSQKLQQYTKEPSKMHKIIFELKELQCSGIIKKLIDNVATVMEKIQQRKKNKNKANSPLTYPLNIAEKQFALKQNLGDQEKWQEWKQMLSDARQKMNKNNRRSPQRNAFAKNK